MKDLVSILCFCIMIHVSASAQYFEVGAFTGVSHYRGDIQTHVAYKEDYNIAFGLFARYNWMEYVSFQVHAYKGEIVGSDSKSDPILGHRSRNFSFRSPIYEVGIQAEYNILGFDLMQSLNFSPYVFLGISGFYHNPRAYLGRELVSLQPLGTEGQWSTGEAYDLNQVAVPGGIGIKWSVNDLVNLGFEMGARKTFTDYLDDVSGKYPDIYELRERNRTAAALSYRAENVLEDPNIRNPVGTNRGNPDKKDWYYFGGMTISFNIGAL